MWLPRVKPSAEFNKGSEVKLFRRTLSDGVSELLVESLSCECMRNV